MNLICDTLLTEAESGSLILMLENLNLFRLTCLIALVPLMWKWMGVYLLRYWSFLSLLICLGALTSSPLLKVPPRKLKSWFVLWSLFLPRLLGISLNLPYSLVCNIVDMSGLVLLAATWNCYLSYKMDI